MPAGLTPGDIRQGAGAANSLYASTGAGLQDEHRFRTRIDPAMFARQRLRTADGGKPVPVKAGTVYAVQLDA